MMNRRGLIRTGAATVGSLALRLLWIVAGAGAERLNYRALVCVFLFGGNGSNNMIVPMDDVNYPAYTAIRGSLPLTMATPTSPVTSVSGAPYAFHNKLSEVASLRSSLRTELAAGSEMSGHTGAAVDARAVSGAATGDSPEPFFSHAGSLSSCSGKMLYRTRAQFDRLVVSAQPIISFRRI